MTEEKKFSRWMLKDSDLKDLDAVKARDLIVKCFFEAQKETFARAKKDFGGSAEEADIMANVLTMVKMVFRDTGGDFENPDKKSIMAAIESLARKASAWGTPADIIDFHKSQIMRIITILT
ncbi:MAG: hypothetical protein ACYC69_12955 [Thermodesulfovibrionales bacterium]